MASLLLGASALAVPPQASAATVCADIDATPAAIGIDRSVAAISCLVNHERTAAGLGPLTVEPRIRTAAQRFAEDMATRGFFAHESPEGTDPGDRISAAGFAWSAFGENIASGQLTPRVVMSDWLASPGHCRNLMTPYFTVAGFGVALAGDGPYWVQDFGRAMGAGAAAAGGAAPTCPRVPAPFDAAPVAAPSAAPAAVAKPTPAATKPSPVATTPAPAPTAAHVSPATKVPTATARRSGRRLTVRVVLPASAGRVAVVVRIRQGSRTIATSTRRRVTGTQRWSMTLPKAGAGRVVVRAGTAKAVVVRFR